MDTGERKLITGNNRKLVIMVYKVKILSYRRYSARVPFIMKIPGITTGNKNQIVIKEPVESIGDLNLLILLSLIKY